MSRRPTGESSSGQRERLAAALRANLKRRKEQLRGRLPSSAPEEGGEPPEPAATPLPPEGEATGR